MTSLDDLLNRGDAEGGESPAQPLSRWLLWALPTAAVLAGALVLVVGGIGYRLWYPLAVAGVLSLMVLARAVTGLRVATTGDPDLDVPGPDPERSDGGFAHAVRRWQTRLAWDRAGLWRSSRPLRPDLVELVDERLRQRRGFTLAGDPVRARAVVGEPLWSYLADPGRTPPPRELELLVAEMERI